MNASLWLAVVLVVGLFFAIRWMRDTARVQVQIEEVRVVRDFVQSLSMKEAPPSDSDIALAAAEVRVVLDALAVPTRLTNIVHRVLGEEPLNFQNLASALTAIERHLIAQKGLSIARYVIWPEPKRVNASDQSKEKAPLTKYQATSESASKDEEALLARLTEKFYSSAPFKMLGAALIGAVLLAGAGVLFLGGQALNLHEGLNKAATEQKQDLKDLVDQQKESIKAESSGAENVIKSQTAQMASTYSDFQNFAHNSQNKLTDDVTKFESDAATLEKKTFDAVVDKVSGDLSKKSSELSDLLDKLASTATQQFDERVGKIQKNLDAIESLVASAMKELSGPIGGIEASIVTVKLRVQDAQNQFIAPIMGIESQLRNIKDLLQDARTQLNSSAGGIEKDIENIKARVLLTGTSLEAIEIKIDEFKARENLLAHVPVETQGGNVGPTPPLTLQNKSAQEAGQWLVNVLNPERPDFSKVQEEVDILKLQDFPAQLAKQKQDLSEIERQTKVLQANIDGIGKRLEQISSAKAEVEQVQEISKHVDQLAQTVKDMQAPRPVPTPTPPLANLSRNQWRKVQRALKKIVFEPDIADGLLGTNTKDAVRKYQQQRADHPPVTGDLTQDQANDLLK
jgi:Mg2+ and Co2+ transporter CorA